MRTVRFILAACYALAGLLSLIPVGLFVRYYGRQFNATEPSVLTGSSLMLILLALSITFAWTSWAAFLNKPSSSKWILVSSSISLLLGIADFSRHHLTLTPVWLALGIVGLIFSLLSGRCRSEMTSDSNRPVAEGRTFRVRRLLVTVAGMVGVYELRDLWSEWATTHGYPAYDRPLVVIELLVIACIVLIIHEAGHAIAALAVGMKVTAFVIGPLDWTNNLGRWKFTFRPRGLGTLLGQTRVVPTRKSGFVKRKLFQVAAGPLANVLTAALASVLVGAVHTRLLVQNWQLVADFSSISVVGGILNLVPFDIGDGCSDGAKLIQFCKGGIWSDYQLLISMIYGMGVTSIRARDYNLATIQEAKGTLARGVDELLMDLSAYAYHLDRDDFPAALDALRQAEQFSQEAAVSVPKEWYSVFVFGFALLGRDPKRAGIWWQKVAATENWAQDNQHWTSLAALQWSEGRLEEASDTLVRGAEWANSVPTSGFAEAEKHAVDLLRAAIKESIQSTNAVV